MFHDTKTFDIMSDNAQYSSLVAAADTSRSQVIAFKLLSEVYEALVLALIPESDEFC